jgi:phage virion morphogenesis protein
MAGTFIQVKIDDAEIRALLKQLAHQARGLAPAMKNIGEYLVRSTWERFDLQKDPEGKPWTPLAPSTRERKKEPRILIESHQLRDTINYRADDRSVTIGSPKVYAAIHQFGGRTRAHVIKPRNKKALNWPGGKHPVGAVNHPGSNIPARPFLGLSKEDREEIVEIIRDHLIRHRGGKGR